MKLNPMTQSVVDHATNYGMIFHDMSGFKQLIKPLHNEPNPLDGPCVALFDEDMMVDVPATMLSDCHVVVYADANWEHSVIIPFVTTKAALEFILLHKIETITA